MDDYEKYIDDPFDYEKYLDDPLEVKACTDLNKLLSWPLWIVDRYEDASQDTPAQVIIESGKITTLDLVQFFIGDSLPESIGNLIYLKKAFLSEVKFKEFPESMKKLTNLKVLLLYGCGLSIFPEFIYSLTNLERLDLSRNEIDHIPESITNLKSLRILNLRENKLASLPNSLVNLMSLKELNLSWNNKELLRKNSQDIINKLRNQGCSVNLFNGWN